MEDIACTKSSRNLRILLRSRDLITMVTGAIRFKVDSHRGSMKAKPTTFALRQVLEKLEFRVQHTLEKN